MASETIQAIDVHGHYGRYDRGRPDIGNDFMTGGADVVVHRARRANIRLTMVSPLVALLPRGHHDPVAGNRDAARIAGGTPGLLQYVVVDPRRPETHQQAEEMLQLPTCVGIKIHPEEHVYPIRDYGAAIFDFAARHRAIVLSHSGDRNSLPADLVVFANQYPETRLILGHIGCGWDGDYTHQVRAIQQSRHGNVYADTSAARSITPNLIEWAVRQVGADRILFGTDTPLYHASMQRARLDHADLTDVAKRMILRENAERLFNLTNHGSSSASGE